MRTTFISSLLAAGIAAGSQPNPPNWDTSKVIIVDPTDTDCQTRIDAIWREMGGETPCKNGQWSTSRYALFFKPGTHACNVNVGYYTQLLGLGKTPNETVIANLYSPDSCGDALCNFWRGVENAEFGHAQTDVMWHVSQAAPMRRTRIVGDITLGIGWSSGGYMGNTEVTGNINAYSQQQWYFRNTSMGNFRRGAWSFVFQGCEGAPATNCGTGGTGNPATTLPSTPIIAEKPYITIGDDGKYTLHRPVWKTERAGTDFADDGADEIDFSDVYVANESESAATINQQLDAGMHVVLQPGIYNLDAPLHVQFDKQVLLGIGMATLISTNGNPCVEVADGVDARVAGLLLEAGKTKSSTLLKWGSDTTQGNETAPGIVQDVFARVGGMNNSDDYEVTTERMIEINNKYVVIDHTWLWRADHDVAGSVYDGKNYVEQGLQVNADNVKAYGLFSEHSLGDLVQWNGNNGEVYFFQSELPYDVKQDYADSGYAGFKVGDNVTDFHGYGIAVYTFFRDYTVTMPSSIKAPSGDGIKFQNSFNRFLNGFGGITHVINDQGTAVSTDATDSYLCDYHTSGEETFTKTRYGAQLFLQ